MSLGPAGASLDPEQAENFEDVSGHNWSHSQRTDDVLERWRNNLPSKVCHHQERGHYCTTTLADIVDLTAVQHMTTYWAILEKMKGSQLRLTKLDDEIYDHFSRDFPEFDPSETIDEEKMKSKSGKERWRNFMMAYEKKVDDYNFGTMLRSNPKYEYGEKETMFGTFQESA